MNLLTTRFDKFEPFEELTTLRNRLDRLFYRFDRRFGENFDEPIYSGNWMPTTDIFETKDNLIIKAELPGMEMKDINVEIENNVLTIQGERKFEEKTEEKGFQRFERAYGKFVRTFTLPPGVNPDKIVATYNNGILELDLPKKEEAKPKNVHVDVKKALTTAKAA